MLLHNIIMLQNFVCNEINSKVSITYHLVLVSVLCLYQSSWRFNANSRFMAFFLACTANATVHNPYSQANNDQGYTHNNNC